jgi:hypothetical protein
VQSAVGNTAAQSATTVASVFLGHKLHKRFGVVNQSASPCLEMRTKGLDWRSHGIERKKTVRFRGK